MASSFISQIPQIIYLISQIKPKTILDIGKGFGKYGFLIHEYIGIDNKKALKSNKTMKEQSNIRIDAIEIDEQLFLPHMDQIYNNVYKGNILELYNQIPAYDLILMIDVVEHLDKKAAVKMLEYFISQKIKMIVATPEKYFQQHLYDSPFEEHVSYWNLKDFKKISYVDYQKLSGGVIYLLATQKMNIRGFGNSLIKKVRRIARSLKDEF
jgi:hypothetical protein